MFNVLTLNSVPQALQDPPIDPNTLILVEDGDNKTMYIPNETGTVLSKVTSNIEDVTLQGPTTININGVPPTIDYTITNHDDFTSYVCICEQGGEITYNRDAEIVSFTPPDKSDFTWFKINGKQFNVTLTGGSSNNGGGGGGNQTVLFDAPYLDNIEYSYTDTVSFIVYNPTINGSDAAGGALTPTALELIVSGTAISQGTTVVTVPVDTSNRFSDLTINLTAVDKPGEFTVQARWQDTMGASHPYASLGRNVTMAMRIVRIAAPAALNNESQQSPPADAFASVDIEPSRIATGYLTPSMVNWHANSKSANSINQWQPELTVDDVKMVFVAKEDPLATSTDVSTKIFIYTKATYGYYDVYQSFPLNTTYTSPVSGSGTYYKKYAAGIFYNNHTGELFVRNITQEDVGHVEIYRIPAGDTTYTHSGIIFEGPQTSGADAATMLAYGSRIVFSTGYGYDSNYAGGAFTLTSINGELFKRSINGTGDAWKESNGSYTYLYNLNDYIVSNVLPSVTNALRTVALEKTTRKEPYTTNATMIEVAITGNANDIVYTYFDPTRNGSSIEKLIITNALTTPSWNHQFNVGDMGFGYYSGNRPWLSATSDDGKVTVVLDKTLGNFTISNNCPDGSGAGVMDNMFTNAPAPYRHDVVTGIKLERNVYNQWANYTQFNRMAVIKGKGVYNDFILVAISTADTTTMATNGDVSVYLLKDGGYDHYLLSDFFTIYNPLPLIGEAFGDYINFDLLGGSLIVSTRKVDNSPFGNYGTLLQGCKLAV